MGSTTKGGSPRWKRQFPTVSDLPTSGNRAGDRHTVLDDGDGNMADYGWTGSAWIKMADPDGSGVPLPVSIGNGGTGQTSAPLARTALGVEGARARTWRVDTSGRNLSTIGAAVALAATGDRIEVAPGAYVETAEWDLTTKALLLDGAGSDRVSVTFSGARDYGAQVSASQTFRGMKLICGGMGVAGLRLLAACSDQRFEDVEIDPGARAGVLDETAPDTATIVHRGYGLRFSGGAAGGAAIRVGNGVDEAWSYWYAHDSEALASFAAGAVFDCVVGAWGWFEFYGCDDSWRARGSWLRVVESTGALLVGGSYMPAGGDPSIDFSSAPGSLILYGVNPNRSSVGTFDVSAPTTSVAWGSPYSVFPGMAIFTGTPSIDFGIFGGGSAGLVPARGLAAAGAMLRADGTWGSMTYVNTVHFQPPGTNGQANGAALKAAIEALPQGTTILIHGGSYGIEAGIVNNNSYVDVVGVGQVFFAWLYGGSLSGDAALTLGGTGNRIENLYMSADVRRAIVKLSGSKQEIFDCYLVEGSATPGDLILVPGYHARVASCRFNGNAKCYVRAYGSGASVDVDDCWVDPLGGSYSAGNYMWEAKDGGTIRVNRQIYNPTGTRNDAFCRATGTAGSKVYLSDVHVSYLTDLVTVDGTSGSVELHDVTFRDVTRPLVLNATASVVGEGSPCAWLSGSSIAGGASVSLSIAIYEGPWHTVGGSGEPAFENGWTWSDSGTYAAAFRKVGTTVQLRGTIQDGTDGVAAFTLPAGFRPTQDVEMPCVYFEDPGAAEKPGVIWVASGGGVISECPANVIIWLDGVSFTVD